MHVYVTKIEKKSKKMKKMMMRKLERSEPTPTGFRDLTEAELKVAKQIAFTIISLGARGVMLHEFTTNCINLYELPTFPPNSKGRLAIFQVLLQVAQEMIKEFPPQEPNTWPFMRHIVDWQGDF